MNFRTSIRASCAKVSESAVAAELTARRQSLRLRPAPLSARRCPSIHPPLRRRSLKQVRRPLARAPRESLEQPPRAERSAMARLQQLVSARQAQREPQNWLAPAHSEPPRGWTLPLLPARLRVCHAAFLDQACTLARRHAAHSAHSGVADNVRRLGAAEIPAWVLARLHAAFHIAARGRGRDPVHAAACAAGRRLRPPRHRGFGREALAV